MAERHGISYIIIDGGTLADFVEEGGLPLLDQLVKVIAFDSEAERTQCVLDQWPEVLTEEGVHFLPWVAPHAILVLGKRRWSNLPQGVATNLPVDGGTRQARTYDITEGADAIATFINHPASLRFGTRVADRRGRAARSGAQPHHTS